MGFISAYLQHTAEYESPTSFWQWSAYSTVAAVMRDHCYRKYGDSHLYPNIYVLLLAESAIHRKDRPVKTCEHLVDEVNNTKVISGRASIQAVLQELVITETDPKTGKLMHDGGSAIFIAEEMSASIVADPDAIKVLTQIYDYKKEYKLRHIGQGKRTAKKVVFSMLGASNEDLLKGLYDDTAIKGGLLGRTFVILPDEIRARNSLVMDTKEYIATRERRYASLAPMLREIAVLEGEMILDMDAAIEYDSWYRAFWEGIKNKHDKSGIVGRIHTGVLKISMILAADRLSMSVCKGDIEEAIEICTKLLPNYGSFMMTSGKSTIKEAGAIILQELASQPGMEMTRQILIQRHWSDFDPDLLDKVIQAFEQGGLIQQISQGGGKMAYRLTTKCVEIMRGK
jgi:hypothetical protein